MSDLDDRLKRELLHLDVALRTTQLRWETPKAIAMILIAAAAIAAASRLGDWIYPPRPPQPIVIQLQAPHP